MVEQRREGVGHVSNKIIRKKRCRVKRKITTNGAASSVPKTLSELFLTCRGVFKGPGTVPPPHEVQRICDVLGMLFFLSKFNLYLYVCYYIVNL